MSLKEKREAILEEINSKSTKELLSSLKNEHTACENTQFLDRSTHSTGTPSIADRTISIELRSAFHEADALFAQL